MTGLFITGVGTGVGKTLVMTILCHQLGRLGIRVRALKPVVSGFQDGDPESDPALILRSLARPPTPHAIADISPWRFAAPVSPDRAARLENTSVSGAQIVRFCRERGRHLPGWFRLIEGAGGVMSPIASDATCLDVIADLGDPAMLVTGSYLGALSHTLTALSAMRQRAVAVQAIVVSQSAEDMGLAETIEALRDFGAGDVPMYAVKRLEGDLETRLRRAPRLAPICKVDHE
jgi:dethiobiotin synthetase